LGKNFPKWFFNILKTKNNRKGKIRLSTKTMAMLIPTQFVTTILRALQRTKRAKMTPKLPYQRHYQVKISKLPENVATMK